MKKLAWLAVWLIVLSALGMGLGRAYRHRSAGQPAAGGEATGPSVPRVLVAAVKTESLEQFVNATGTVAPEASVTLVPETTGVLELFALPDGTPVREGVRVEKGQVVAQVARRHLEALLREAESRLQVARAARGEAEVQLADTLRDYERMQALYREDVIARRDLEKAEAAWQSARSRIGLVDDQATQAETVVESARLRFEDSLVTSPVSGIVSEKFVDAGAYVSPQSPLARIISIDRVEVTAALPERYLPVLVPGRTPALIRLDAYPDLEFSGIVKRLKPEIDPVTRTVEITILLDNPGHRLKPGMFARVEIPVVRRPGATTVPGAALVEVDGQYFALVVENGVVARRKIRPGVRVGDANEVLEGLRPGETVVIRGHHLLEAGTRVETVFEGGQP